MKLAFVNFYSGYADRGGETYVDSLAEELAKKHQVFLFQAGPKKNGKPYTVEQIKVSYDPSHSDSKLPVTSYLKRLFIDYFHRRELLFTIKLIPKLWKIKPDVIFPQNSGWEVILLKIFSLLSGSKIIVAGQSGPGWNDRVNLFVHPDTFVALTETQAQWAKEATPWKDQRLVVIPNGVDIKKFSPTGKKRVIDLSRPIVFAVGAAIKSKRIVSTIKAVAELKKVSLLVAGTGPEESTEDELGTNLLGNRYKRIKLSHTDMPSVYRSSDVFTLCSDSSEAFGIVYLEALASGLTCVATDDASRRDILGDIGIYVNDPEDPKEYAEKIEEALKQKSPEKNIEQAEKFSWKSIADKYLDLLDVIV